METLKRSAIIIAKNAALEIIPALESLGFLDEIVVVDNGPSTDGTIKIAQKYHLKLIFLLYSVVGEEIEGKTVEN